ncbi:MAG: TM2 domain-containing protein [Saprospiraceae bacterium]
MEILEHETRDLDAETLRSFAIRYKGRRQDEKIILIMACIGFLGVSGIHRFMVRQPLMGVIYLLTGGLCLIGTIIDIIKYKSLTLEYNHKAMKDTVIELTY